MRISEFNLHDLAGQSLLSDLQRDYWSTVSRITALAMPQFTISDVGITHRWITHWDKQGLIDNKRAKSAWRRFSFVEYIWLRIIVRLREFRMPISSIKQIKNYLWHHSTVHEFKALNDEFMQSLRSGRFPPPNDMTVEEFEKHTKKILLKQKSILRSFNLLFWMIFLMQLHKKPICLLIDQNGVCGSIFLAGGEITEASLNILADEIPKTDFICLNLFRILEDFYSNEKLKDEVIQKIAILNDKEKRILELIQKGDFKEISIKLNGNKEYTVGVKRSKPVDKITNEVSSIINRGKYQEIKLVTEKGNIVFAEVTEKIKI